MELKNMDYEVATDRLMRKLHMLHTQKKDSQVLLNNVCGLQLDRSDLEADNCIERLMEYGIVWGAELDIII